MTWLSLENVQFSHVPTGEKGHDAGTGNAYQFDLQLEAGNILAVHGRSGSGKSTLLDIIAGFLNPTVGKITLDDRDITGLPPSEREISVLFQKNNLFEHLSVLQNVCLGLSPDKTPDFRQTQRAIHMIARVGLVNFENRKASILSGGQMQRTALARELLRQTKLILLDEPFNGLDEESREVMLPMLRQAVEERRCSIILVTHDLQSVTRIVDCVGEIRDRKFTPSATG